MGRWLSGAKGLMQSHLTPQPWCHGIHPLELVGLQWGPETHSLEIFYSLGSPQPGLLQVVPCSQLINSVFILSPCSLATLLPLMQAEPGQPGTTPTPFPCLFWFLGMHFHPQEILEGKISEGSDLKPSEIKRRFGMIWAFFFLF